MVGTNGTIRMESHTPGDDLPPPFEGEPNGGAGPSNGLPTFLESEAQMRTGEPPLHSEPLTSALLVPVTLEGEEGESRATTVGRRGSLGGELGTWVEVSDCGFDFTRPS